MSETDKKFPNPDPSVTRGARATFFLLTRQHLAGCSRLFPKRTCLALKAAPSGLGRFGQERSPAWRGDLFCALLENRKSSQT